MGAILDALKGLKLWQIGSKLDVGKFQSNA